MSKVAFIGLGVMGFPMAGHLARAGHDAVVYNRTSAVAGRWVETYGGRSAPTPREAAEDRDFVFACVGNDDDLRSVCLGETGRSPACGRAPSSSITRPPRPPSRANSRGRRKRTVSAFIDAPVSGGQAGAENGQLTVMCGGDDEAFAKVKPMIDAYARSCRLMGPVGAGQLTKMVNQICIAGLAQALSEGVRFAELAGLDPKRVVEVISKGAAQSWQMDHRHETMIARKFDFGFAVDWMRKDLAICLDEARRNGASLPVTALVDQFYSDIQSKGGSRLDTSSLISRL